MPKKDIRYYANTIWLKTNAFSHFYLQKIGLLKGYQDKQKAYFHALYNSHIANDKITLNTSFSSNYVAYSMFENKDEIEPHLSFDDRKIAMCRSDEKPTYYNPLLCAHYTLVCYNDYIKNKDIKTLIVFWKQANHLKDKALANAYRFYYDWKGHHFYSGITQSVIASVFMRAFLLSKEDPWKQLALSTLKQMFVPVEEGGNFIRDTEGYVWIEEYPRFGSKSLVLNGFKYSLIGVYEYLALCKKDVFLEKQAQDMTEALFKTLHFYKFWRYTRYGRFEKTYENIDYEGRNYFLFKHLFELTNNKAFEMLALRTNEQVNWGAFYRLYEKAPPQ